MSLNSHAYKRLCALYRLIIAHQRSGKMIRPTERAFAGLETLEPRLLLSVAPTLLPGDDAVLFAGQSGAETLYLRAAGDILEYSETGIEYSSDLDVGTPGNQALGITSAAEITVDLGGGNEGQVFSGGNGPGYLCRRLAPVRCNAPCRFHPPA